MSDWSIERLIERKNGEGGGDFLLLLFGMKCPF
jgi:hypothetical protein